MYLPVPCNNKPVRTRFRYAILFLLISCMMIHAGYTQVVTESTRKKISVGVSEFTDIWSGEPNHVWTRTINQGFSVLGTYNVPFGKSGISFALGLGMTWHNMYGNFYVNSGNSFTTVKDIPDTVFWKRSKLRVGYFEVPIEFRYRDKSKFNFALGFKGGFLLDSGTKYIGDGTLNTVNYTVNRQGKTTIKMNHIKNMNQFTYGPTMRIGYSWITASFSWMITSIFENNKGPDISSFSIGFMLMPF